MQILTTLDIFVPIDILLDMFLKGLISIRGSDSKIEIVKNETKSNLLSDKVKQLLYWILLDLKIIYYIYLFKYNISIKQYKYITFLYRNHLI